MDTPNLNHLPVTEKLKLVTKLWDDIAASSEPLVIPEEIVSAAERRSAEIDRDPAIVLDDEEVWRRVDG